MIKKYFITDDDGEEYEVTETDDGEELESAEMHDDEALTSDEIAALKQLAACASELVALVRPEGTHDDGEELDGEIKDDEELIEEEKVGDCGDEEILTTRTGDSRRSFGSVERRYRDSRRTQDDIQTEISNAWAKRYESIYKKGE